jgi:hypothetical protein
MYYSSYPYSYISRQQAFTPVLPGYMGMPLQTPQNTRSPFPQVDTRTFTESAKRFKLLMNQANLFIDLINASDDFAHRVMNAAQRSDKTEVERLIRTTGVTIKFNIEYTPSGIRIDFSNSDAESGCCTLRMPLNW